MEIDVSMSTRNKDAFADGIYTKEKFIIKAGGKISKEFHGKENVKRIREDTDFVDANRTIIKECEFKSPSTAAQFVNGNISNGLRVWKVGGVSLGDYLKSHTK